MSTTGLRWGDVSTQNIGATAAQLMRNGGEAITKGFDGLTGVAKGIIDERSRVANGNALSAIMGVTDPNELNAMGQQLMQNGGPEMNKAALFEALNQQKKGLLENQSTQLSNTAQSNLNGVFATNNKNAQDNLIADTAGKIATTAGKVQDNKVGALEFANRPQEIKDRNKAAEQSISMAKEKILQAQDDTRVIGKINDAKVKKGEADAEISAIDSLFRKRQNESGLLTEAQARAASRSSVANQSARLAFDKAQAKAKAGGDANAQLRAETLATHRKALNDAIIKGDREEIARLAPLVMGNNGTHNEISAMSNLLTPPKPDKVPFKDSDSYVEATKSLGDSEKMALLSMVDAVKNSGGVLKGSDGLPVPLNSKGIKDYQTYLAQEATGRWFNPFDIDEKDALTKAYLESIKNRPDLLKAPDGT